jgi:hypothetical protein
MIARDEHSSLLQKCVNYRQKEFYNDETRLATDSRMDLGSCIKFTNPVSSFCILEQRLVVPRHFVDSAFRRLGISSTRHFIELR